jgi:putative DNA primase/helicase
MRDGRTAYASVDMFMSNPSGFFLKLKQQGVIIATAQARAEVTRQIDQTEKWRRKIYVARSTGWHGECFIKPDHSVVGEPPKRFVLDLDSHPIDLACSGTFEDWATAVQTFAAGQSTLTLCLAMAYVGPVLPLLDTGNVGLDLTGPSSIGKSSALNWAASVWGAPLNQPGSIAASLRTTDNAAEQTMFSRRNALLALDEVNLLGIDSRKQADALGNLVFLIAEGVGKDRYNDPSAARVAVASMVTSNKSILEQARQYDATNAEAAAVRFITVNADAGAGYGIFDHLPDGYESSGEAVMAMKAALAESHGHSIDIFLRRLTGELSWDRSALMERIKTYQQVFMAKAGLKSSDGMTHRRAQAFAAIYAAARLANDFGALPLKNIGPRILACYGRSLAAIAGTAAIERVRAYVSEHQPNLRDLDEMSRRSLSDDAFDHHPGFLKRRKGRRCLLIRTARWEAEFGVDANSMLAELNAARLLQTTEARQLQTRVRKNKKKDRVYAIMID